MPVCYAYMYSGVYIQLDVLCKVQISVNTPH